LAGVSSCPVFSNFASFTAFSVVASVAAFLVLTSRFVFSVYNSCPEEVLFASVKFIKFSCCT
jgi:hypothetical protein